MFLRPKVKLREGNIVLALCTTNLKKVGSISKQESHIKEQFELSGGVVNWRVNFKNKSMASCILNRDSIPRKVLKALDKCKFRFVTQSQ